MGRTPLHSSAEKGYPDVCEFLLQREAKLESLDEVFCTHTPLCKSIRHPPKFSKTAVEQPQMSPYILLISWVSPCRLHPRDFVNWAPTQANAKSHLFVSEKHSKGYDHFAVDSRRVHKCLQTRASQLPCAKPTC
jgi:hypothetical protein